MSRDPRYKQLVSDLADTFDAGDCIRPSDIPELTDRQLSIILGTQDAEAGYDAARPLVWADILGCDQTTEVKDKALIGSLRYAFQQSASEYVYQDVNDVLFERQEPMSRYEYDELRANDAGETLDQPA